MAPLKDGQARIHSRRASQKPTNFIDPFEDGEIASDIDLEPPSKRQRIAHSSLGVQKWVPGGRRAGGRRTDLDTSETELQTPRSKDGYFEQKRLRARHDTILAAHPIRTSSRRAMTRPQPRYSTATAAAAAADGYKPREERGWEEFHPDFDLESDLAVIPSEHVDGLVPSYDQSRGDHDAQKSENDIEEDKAEAQARSQSKRRAGRPLRRADSMLHGLHTPEKPRIVPPPVTQPSRETYATSTFLQRA